MPESNAMDNVITDLSEIARLSELNGERNIEFSEYLRHGLRWEHEKLDAVVHEILAEVEPQIHCTACANCCREMGIAVEDEDIAHLAQRLGISPEEFESRHIAVDEDDGEKFMPESPCPLLGGNLCTVYEDRPAVCREFPHLHKPEFRRRLLCVVDTSSLCPIVFNVYEELKRRTGWRPRQ